MKKKRRIFLLFAIALILLIPLLGMQFSANVNWTLSDFILAAVLLFCSGFLIDLIARKISDKRYRVTLFILILILLLLAWSEIGVGFLETLLTGN